jgi:hypothetical protein
MPEEATIPVEKPATPVPMSIVDAPTVLGDAAKTEAQAIKAEVTAIVTRHVMSARGSLQRLQAVYTRYGKDKVEAALGETGTAELATMADSLVTCVGQAVGQAPANPMTVVPATPVAPADATT